VSCGRSAFEKTEPVAASATPILIRPPLVKSCVRKSARYGAVAARGPIVLDSRIKRFGPTGLKNLGRSRMFGSAKGRPDAVE